MKGTREQVFAVGIAQAFEACQRVGDQLRWRVTKVDSDAHLIEWPATSSLIAWGVGHAAVLLESIDLSHTRVVFTYQCRAVADPLKTLDGLVMRLFEPFRTRLEALQPPVSTQEATRCPICGVLLAEGVKFCPNDGSPVTHSHTQGQGAFCSNCGSKVAAEGKYCPECGAPRFGAGQPSPQKTSTTCEIVFVQTSTGLTGIKGHFEAKAIGPAGTFSAGVSPVFRVPFLEGGPDVRASDSQVAEFHRALIDTLVRAGWHPSGDRGTDWWNHRFCR